MARYPLNGNPRISSTHGQKTNMGHFGRHLGIDRVVPVGTPIYAPANGRVISSSYSDSLGNVLEVEMFGLHWRFAHNKSVVKKSGSFKEGDLLAYSGNTGITTGPHSHYDARKIGTAWNASFNNYVDPDKVIAQAIEASKPKFNMPPVGSRIQLIPRDSRTTYKAGTTTPASSKKIEVTDNSFIYIVRGYDPKFPNRIIINSKSAGGDGVALALYYTNGQIIPGWKKV